MPRRWFQIHLSTCIVLMLVAGGLMWANIRPEPVLEVDGRVLASQHGWPFPCAISGDLDALNYVEFRFKVVASEPIDPHLLAVDLVFTVFVFALSALLCEPVYVAANFLQKRLMLKR